MIRANDIKFSDDGTQAWWSLPRELDQYLNRPCDTCGDGRKRYPGECLDCHGSGRHCFEIEVECGRRHASMASRDTKCHEWAMNRCDGTRTFTVSVVPGMVLPVVDYRSTDTGFDRMRLGPEGSDCRGTLFRAKPSDDDLRLFDLPAATKPGDWLIRLDIYQGGPT